MKIVIDEDELYPDYELLEYPLGSPQLDSPKAIDMPEDLVARYNAARTEYMRLRDEISAIVIWVNRVRYLKSKTPARATRRERA